MRFEAFNLRHHGLWARQLVQAVYCDDTRGIVAVRDGEPVGVVLMDSWTPSSVQVHMGATTPMVWRHGLHEQAFHYLFNVTGRQRVYGLIPANRPMSVKLAEHFGFQLKCVLDDGFDECVDYLLYEMCPDQCRYLPSMEEAFGAGVRKFG